MQILTHVIYTVTLCLMVTLSNIAAAGLYKWVDKDGKMNYSTTRPTESEVSNEGPAPLTDKAPQTPESKTLRPQPKRTSQKPANEYSDDRLSLNFNEVELAKLFAIFADFSRNKIVIDPSIRQTVAVHYFEVEWEPTMYEIAARYNLSVKVENGTIYVKKNGSR